jgi:hypothetical protein
MPVLLTGDSNMAILPMDYSPATVARKFSVLEEVSLRDTLYQIVLDESIPFVAVIEATPTFERDAMRHKVVATLELQRRPQLEGVLVRKFWENSDVAQVEGVVVDGALRDIGLATLIYETIALKAGMTLLSDNEQYAGGKALWQHIARQSTKLAVYVLDTDTARYYPFDGDRLQYDGQTIPESDIWSEHPDTCKHPIVLVAELREKSSVVAA